MQSLDVRVPQPQTPDTLVLLCPGMPYTGVKGEFEVVGFTTLTYVLVLVGTYGALDPQSTTECG